MDKLDSVTIKSLRFPLACMVVFIHTNVCVEGWEYSSEMWLSPTNVDLFRIVNIGFCKIFSGIAVPTFFFISGLLFFYGLETWNWEICKHKIKRRFFSLFVPYFVWVFIYVCYVQIRQGNDFENFCVWLDKSGGLINVMWSNVILVPMWFIRALMVQITLTPIIFLILKKRKHILISLLFLMGVFLLYMFDLPSIISLQATLFFWAGSFISLNTIDLLNNIHRYRWVITTMFLILFIIEVFLGGTTTSMGKLLNPFFEVIGICFLFLVMKRICNSEKTFSGGSRILQSLSAHTFFIFAFHVFVLKDFLNLFFETMLKVESDCIPISIVNNHFLICLCAVGISVVATITTCIILNRYIVQKVWYLNKLLNGR